MSERAVIPAESRVSRPSPDQIRTGVTGLRGRFRGYLAGFADLAKRPETTPDLAFCMNLVLHRFASFCICCDPNVSQAWPKIHA